MSKENGGLGVKHLGCLYKVLISKWSWHFVVERGTLWNDVIRAKHREQEEGWSSCEVRERYDMGLWKAIRRW